MIESTIPISKCPFCAGLCAIEMTDSFDHERYLYYVKCAECGVEQGKYFDAPDDAINIWNIRKLYFY